MAETRRVHAFGEVEAQRRAAAHGLDRVDVLLDEVRVVEGAALARREHVVDVAGVLCREADEAQREPVLSDRDVQHRADVVARVALRNARDLRLGPGVEAGGIGLRRDDAQCAGLGAGAVQRALRSAQRLDALDIDEARVGIAPALRDWLLVEIEGG